MKLDAIIPIAALSAGLICAGALSSCDKSSDFVHISDVEGLPWVFLKADIARIEPGFLNRTNILVRLRNPDRTFMITEREAYDRMYSTLMAEIERLRQIAAHVPAAIYIKAKEAAGYGVVVRVNREELCEGSKLAIKGENQYL